MINLKIKHKLIVILKRIIEDIYHCNEGFQYPDEDFNYKYQIILEDLLSIGCIKRVIHELIHK